MRITEKFWQSFFPSSPSWRILISTTQGNCPHCSKVDDTSASKVSLDFWLWSSSLASKVARSHNSRLLVMRIPERQGLLERIPKHCIADLKRNTERGSAALTSKILRFVTSTHLVHMCNCSIGRLPVFHWASTKPASLNFFAIDCHCCWSWRNWLSRKMRAKFYLTENNRSWYGKDFQN